jgi:hypothetical protein
MMIQKQITQKFLLVVSIRFRAMLVECKSNHYNQKTND